MVDRVPDAGADLTLSSITKKFGSFTAVDDLDLVVEQGQFFAFDSVLSSGKISLLSTRVESIFSMACLAPSTGQM